MHVSRMQGTRSSAHACVTIYMILLTFLQSTLHRLYAACSVLGLYQEGMHPDSVALLCYQ